MNDLTVIYYTCNREKPEFEAKIQNALLEAIQGLPIISVSQKPIKFGENICVGEIGATPLNAWRQLQIGVKAAKTKFVCPAEADFLYPKERFTYPFEREDLFYQMQPCYMLKDMKFWRCVKPSDASMVIGREYFIESLAIMLKRQPSYGEARPILWRSYRRRNQYRVSLPIPMVTFKTPENMSDFDMHYMECTRTNVLPKWGTPEDLIRRFL